MLRIVKGGGGASQLIGIKGLGGWIDAGLARGPPGTSCDGSVKSILLRLPTQTIATDPHQPRRGAQIVVCPAKCSDNVVPLVIRVRRPLSSLPVPLLVWPMNRSANRMASRSTRQLYSASQSRTLPRIILPTLARSLVRSAAAAPSN